jgi:hypothetical protein
VTKTRLLASLLTIPVWTLLGGFGWYDSAGAEGVPIGMMIGTGIGFVFALALSGLGGKLVDFLFGPEERDDR